MLLQSVVVILGWIGPYRIPVCIHIAFVTSLPSYLPFSQLLRTTQNYVLLAGIYRNGTPFLRYTFAPWALARSSQ